MKCFAYRSVRVIKEAIIDVADDPLVVDLCQTHVIGNEITSICLIPEKCAQN